MARWFSEIEVRRYQDGLIVTEPEPLVAYVLSTITVADDLMKGKWEAFAEFVDREVALHGSIHIAKDSGLFLARK